MTTLGDCREHSRISVPTGPRTAGGARARFRNRARSRREKRRGQSTMRRTTFTKRANDQISRAPNFARHRVETRCCQRKS